MCGWAGQLSTISAIFLPSLTNFLSSSLTHSSNNALSIQLFFCDRYRQGRFLTPAKHLGLADLPMTNICICSSHTSKPSSKGGRFGKEPIRGQDFKFQPIREPYLAHVTRFDREANFWGLVPRARPSMGSRLGPEMTSRDRK